MIEPIEKDKGKYSIMITDPENSHKRTLDLSGDGQYLLSLSFAHSLSVSLFFFYWYYSYKDGYPLVFMELLVSIYSLRLWSDTSTFWVSNIILIPAGCKKFVVCYLFIYSAAWIHVGYIGIHLEEVFIQISI